MPSAAPGYGFQTQLWKKLESMIATMPLGARLPTEKDLAEQFEVGRSTIRESKKILSSRNMIVQRNGGAFVSDPVKDCLVKPLSLIINMEVGNIGSLMELREILELNAIRMACGRGRRTSSGCGGCSG